MDPQLSAALIALGITVIGALGTLVTLLVERVKRDLAANTQITQETREGLQDAVERLAAARNTILGLRLVVREREDRIAYLLARIPEAEQVLVGYYERRRSRHSEAEEHAAERRILEESGEQT